MITMMPSRQPDKRGDVVLVLFPDPNLRTAKHRPGRVVQVERNGIVIVRGRFSEMRRIFLFTFDQHTFKGWFGSSQTREPLGQLSWTVMSACWVFPSRY